MEVGASLAGGGDIDGDGLDDFVIGSPGDADLLTNAGAVYLFTSPPIGTVAAKVADAKLRGEARVNNAGTSVAMAGDIDGDGLEDFVVGAPGEATGGVQAGAAYLITAAPSGTGSLSSSTAKLLGAAGSGAGYAVAGAGDVNVDGFADLLVSAPAASSVLTDAGEAFLVLGPVSSVLGLPTDHDGWFLGEQESAGAGMRIAAAGDLDGDGLADLLVSAPALTASGYPDGAAYVLLGSTLFPEL